MFLGLSEPLSWSERLFSWPWRPWQKYRPIPEFRPCVVQNDELQMTEMILADEAIVWTPWRGAKLHSVDLGYDLEGNLIGIKIWDTVAKRDN